MTDLVSYQPPWVALLEPAAELARLVGKTEFVPASLRNREAAIAACVLYGAELGLSPMQSLAKIPIIDGRPAPAAELARALALSAGHDVWVEESTTQKATLAGQRKNSGHVQRVTWTMEDARRAGLDSKRNWRTYPRQMLVARATAELIRNIAPDVLGGLITAEELDEVVTIAEPATPLADAAPATRTRKRSLKALPTPPDADEPEPVEATATEDDVVPEAPSGKQLLPTAPQKRLMFALMHDVEVNDDEARLKLTSEVLGRPVESSNDLSRAEMQLLLDDLERRKAEGWVAY